jgi:predicted secreted protein
VDGATARTYGVRTADAGDTLRVGVTAHNTSGSTATAYSDQTATVTSNGGTTTVVTTRNNRRPSLALISVRRVGTQIFARFRVCDDSTARVRVTQRDTKRGLLAYKRTFLVKARPCLTYSRHWTLAPRFRHGRYTAALQARDRLGATSAVRARSLVFR